MTMLAKTDASGGTGLLPEVLAFTSSLELDRQLLREDLVGSLAHLIMLARTGLIPKEDAAAIRAHLLSIAQDADAGTLSLPEEEDVHMAVEARSEEHTSELQSRENLACRLLLEKKK